MDKKFLDYLYERYFFYRDEVNRLKEIKDFPGDGYSHKLHKIRLRTAERNHDDWGVAICEYLKAGE